MMKNTMSKKAARMMLVVLTALSMTACGGKKTTCDFCSEEKVCQTKKVFGDEIHICKDCQKELNSLK